MTRSKDESPCDAVRGAAAGRNAQWYRNFAHLCANVVLNVRIANSAPRRQRPSRSVCFVSLSI
ncbi:hypothetical protein C6T62_15460 [Burkholderia multivorans]|nr:hypothetical protein C6T62_15460 [Burkholderia multivorans]